MRQSSMRLAVAVAAVSSAGRGHADPLQPWGGAGLNEWMNASKAVVISDMTRCTPSSALSPNVGKGRWKILPYVLRGGQRGKMVCAGQETGAPPLRLPLGASGWHAIFVGVFSTSEAPSQVWLKLDTDPAPTPRYNRSTAHYGNVEDVFFKVAELTESVALHIRQQSAGFTCGCGIAHVKLVPLTEAEVQRVRQRRNDPSRRNLAATCDGFSFIYYRRPTTAEELLSEVEIYRDTDFGTLYLHSPGADKVNYASKVGHMKGTGIEDFPRAGDRHFVEAIRELARRKINPVKVLIDGAHDVGMRIHVGIRPAGWSFFEPYAEYWESPFYRQHPQWRCEDRDGTPVTRMSWAVPEVRKHFIDLLAEQVAFGADGAHIVFNRGYPLVLYERPFRDLFEKQHAIDPRKIPESDPRIGGMWSGVVTAFFRELRAVLDAEQQRRGDGKRLAISACVLGHEQDNLRYGVDVRRLVNEGLLDEIMVYGWGFGNKRAGYELAFFKEVCGPKNIPFRPSLAVHWPDLGRRVGQAISFYEGGAAGAAIWDAGIKDIYEWTLMSRLGRLEDARGHLKHIKGAKPPHTYHRFHRLGNHVRDGRFGPYWGG